MERRSVYNSPSEITSAAIKVNPDSIAKETLHLFCQIFGSVTGSIALSTGCLGGIYITSDLVRNFLDLFIESDFQKSFERQRATQNSYMTDIPSCTYQKRENMGLIGSTLRNNNTGCKEGLKSKI